EAKVRLGRIGFDSVAGYLNDPMQVFLDSPSLVETSSRLTATELADRLAAVPAVVILDVRNPGELERGVIPGHIHIPLAALKARLDELDPTAPTVTHCTGGSRSSVVARVLDGHGFTHFSDVR